MKSYQRVSLEQSQYKSFFELDSKSVNLYSVTMSEKLCLQWNDFKGNVNSAFGRLRDDKELTDVTLACEDGQQMEAHKVILAASSPFLEKILQRNKHPHPLIYLRGFQSHDLLAILDFLYFGEANIYQENLDPFLAIADGLKLKGLTGQTSSDVVKEPQSYKPVNKAEEVLGKSTVHNSVNDELVPKVCTVERSTTALAIPNQFSGDLEALDEKVKSLMGKSQNMVPNGKHVNGTPRQASAYICKVCGKEGNVTQIRNHIEANHLEGISIPCDFCGKALGSRGALEQHKRKYHGAQM